MRGGNDEHNKTIFIGYLDVWTTGYTTRDMPAYKLILVSCLVLSCTERTGVVADPILAP